MPESWHERRWMCYGCNRVQTYQEQQPRHTTERALCNECWQTAGPAARCWFCGRQVRQCSCG